MCHQCCLILINIVAAGVEGGCAVVIGNVMLHKKYYANKNIEGRIKNLNEPGIF